MTNVYKINLFRWDFSERDKCNEYCIQQNYIGWGWPEGNPEKVKNIRDHYKSPKNTLKTAVKRIENMKVGDLCWTYGANKKWYLGKITGEEYECGPVRATHPAIGMLRACEWHEVKNFDLIPGEILCRSHNDKTIRCITENISSPDDYITYCQLLYDNPDETKNISLDFWSLTHPDDLEDMVGLYLQTHGYYIFPSTNKRGTKDYEFRLVRSDGNKEVIVQCKNNADIPLDDLENTYTKEEIYILSIKGNHSPKYTSPWEMGWQSEDSRIKIFDAEKLKFWAQENIKIMPKRIQKFLELSK